MKKEEEYVVDLTKSKILLLVRRVTSRRSTGRMGGVILIIL